TPHFPQSHKRAVSAITYFPSIMADNGTDQGSEKVCPTSIPRRRGPYSLPVTIFGAKVERGAKKSRNPLSRNTFK
ncbi:MAG: hypothetical protein WBD45_04325, partial [Terriglobales bacterium]